MTEQELRQWAADRNLPCSIHVVWTGEVYEVSIHRMTELHVAEIKAALPGEWTLTKADGFAWWTLDPPKPSSRVVLFLDVPLPQPQPQTEPAGEAAC